MLQIICMTDLTDFLEPLTLLNIREDENFLPGQMGHHTLFFEEELPELDGVNVVIAGITEYRGDGLSEADSFATDAIRKHLYRLHYWHTEIKIADIGNIKCGATLKDTYAAIAEVTATLKEAGKIVLLIGGSHDNTLGQYGAYKRLNQQSNISCLDAFVNLSQENPEPAKNFLMELLTGEPNFVLHYNHLAFQSYFVHPTILQTLDKLRFDFYRIGQVTNDIEEMEPVLRDTDMFSIDISAVKHSDAPANKNCPNGLTGVEACTISRFAGMSQSLSSIGFYGYDADADVEELTARQISQMIWYFIDGVQKKKQESTLSERNNFNEFYTRFGEVDTLFLQSKRTQRWWMQMPDKNFIPCSPADYKAASRNDIPERWFRLQERS